MPTLLDEDLTKDGIEALSSRPFRNVSRQSSRQMSLCGTPEKSSYRQLSVSDRSSIRVEEIIPAARVAIQVRSLWVWQGLTVSHVEALAAFFWEQMSLKWWKYMHVLYISGFLGLIPSISQPPTLLGMILLSTIELHWMHPPNSHQKIDRSIASTALLVSRRDHYYNSDAKCPLAQYSEAELLYLWLSWITM